MSYPVGDCSSLRSLGLVRPDRGAKLIIQATWLQQLEGDEPLRDEEASTWHRLREELPLLEAIRVPRWLQCDLPTGVAEIHGVSDVSEQAYAAVVYVRVVMRRRAVVTLV